MSQFYGSEIHGSHLRLRIALFGAMLVLTGSGFQTPSGTPIPKHGSSTPPGSITWLDPPPVETVRDASSVSTTTVQVVQGSLNEELSCNFSLTADMTARSVSLKVGDVTAAIVIWNKLRLVEPAFTKNFDVVWIPNKLTLIFFNVTDAQEDEYLCEVTTAGRTGRLWNRKIQLLVLDPSQTMAPSITVSQNPSQTMAPSITVSQNAPIQTTVSAITASEGPIQTTDYTTRALEDHFREVTIGAVAGTISLLTIALAIVWCFKQIKRCAMTMHFVVHGY